MARVPDEKEAQLGFKSKNVIWEDRLSDLGYKVTGPRKLILKLMEKQPSLVDAYQLFLEVRKKDPKIGIATVYRTLELLTRLKIVHRVSVGMDKSLYMLAGGSKHASVYMVCEKCKSVIIDNECLKDAIKIRLKEGAEKNILKNCNIKIDNFQIAFTGLCDKCS
jgi:Fur family ferric uptake transcriptional regulator